MKDLKADFGAVGDDTTDDTLNVQAALDWVANAHDDLYVPPGFYKITSGLSLVQKTGFRVRGPAKQAGTYNTAFRWYGSGGTMLMLDGVRDSEWWDLALDARVAAGEPACLLEIDKIAAGSWAPRKNAFRRMLLRGGSVATVRIAHTSLAGNEANIFEDVTNSCVPGSTWVNGVPGGPVGYWVKNVNAKAQQIIGGEINGKDAAVFCQEGSFQLHRVELSGCNVWVRKGAGGEPCFIEACDGDSSKTFLELTLSQTGPVTATGNRFIQAFDGPLFIFGDTIGPVVLQGNEFAGGGHRTAVQCFSTIPGNGPMVTAIGNTFPNDQILPIPTPASANRLRSLYMLANMHYSPGNVRNLMNDYLVPNRNTGASVAALQIHGSSGFKADVQSVVQAVQTIQTNQAVASVTTTAFWTLRSTPTFQPGMFEGQELRLTNTGANDLGLLDEKTLPGSQLCLLERSPVFKPKASATFQWTAAYGGRWIQVSPVVSPL